MGDPAKTRVAMKRLQVINIAAYILNVFVTYASQAILPKLGGKTNGEVSKEFTSIVTPAGYAFTIWAVIFIGEAVFTVWQGFSEQDDSPLVHAAGLWWAGACVFQVSWSFAFAYEVMWLSTVFLFGITACLGVVYFNLHKESIAPTNLQWWIVVFPFATHFGWCIAASVLNVNLSFIKNGASVDTQYAVAIASLIAVALIPAACAWPKGDPVVGSVAGWALIAIGKKLMASDGVFQQGPATTDTKHFNVDSLHKFAHAGNVVAAAHLVVVGGILLRRVYRMYITRPEVPSSDYVDAATASAVLQSPNAKLMDNGGPDGAMTV